MTKRKEKHKPQFDKERSQFLDEISLTRVQWLQDPNQSDVDNIKTIRT